MSFYQLIEKKKNAEELSSDEVFQVVQSYMSGEATDAQMAAFLMSVRLNGMTAAEAVTLTEAMAESGDVLDTSGFPMLLDKHSTGGVGDKTTFLVGSMLSALGYDVGMMSGRGLGHTGGTIDKLESFPGFKAQLSAEEYFGAIRSAGLSIIEQSAEVAPADKRLYALRNETATVDSLPLIAASIMSKKLASGTRNIVFDVKYGSSAFLPDAASAEELGNLMSDIAVGAGMRAGYVTTAADDVLGSCVGNASEVMECLEIMNGNRPVGTDALVDLSLDLSTRLIEIAGERNSSPEARNMFESTLSDGTALNAFARFLSAQGVETEEGDFKALSSLLPLPDTRIPVTANGCGIIRESHPKEIGLLCADMGANRRASNDAIFHDVGIRVIKHIGDSVVHGEPVAFVEYNKETSEARLTSKFGDLGNIAELFARCWEIE